MPENTELFLKIIGGVFTAFLGYHRYMISLLNKKMDKEDCARQQEILAEKRLNIEIILEERTKTIFKKQEEIQEDLKIIKEHITKSGGNYDR